MSFTVGTKVAGKLERIMEALRACMPELRKRYGVRSLGVFGSYLRGEQRRNSDLDILVEFDPASRLSLLDFVRLRDELSDTLGLKVDLVERAGLKPYIGRRILEEVVNVSEAEGASSILPGFEGGAGLPRREREIRDYLKDILDGVADVEQFTQGASFEGFYSNRQRVYAVLHAMLIIGEAASKVPVPVRRKHPEVPWRSIVGLRNIVAHEYFAVQVPRIWQIIQENFPSLRAAVTRMLAELEG